LPTLGPAYFSPLTPPPPRPTLFPYTTLFRSRRRLRDDGRQQRVHLGEDLGDERARIAGAEPEGLEVVVRREVEADLESRPHRRLDRKSTRLNSSHVSISYAVFCLQKKNPGTG